MSSSSSAGALYDIKSADLPLVVFHLRTHDLNALSQALHAQLAESPGFFDQDATLIDLDGLPASADALDWPALLNLLRAQGLQPVACKSADPQRLAAAQAQGLARGDDARVRRAVAAMASAPAPNPAPTAAPTAAAQAPAKPAPEAVAPAGAMVLDKPLRSGQQVYAKGRDLVVLAMVNPGAEVIADGHIHIYASLRGKAIAGARGFTQARIFAQSMDPELISIAGVYRTSETPLPASVRGRAAQVSLSSGEQGDKLLITALSA